MTSNGNLHPGISIHNIRVGGGAAGLLFAAGSMLVFLLGIPVMRWFLVGSVALGLVLAVVLKIVHKYFTRPLTQLPSARL